MAVLALAWTSPLAAAATALDNDTLVERVDPAIVRVLNTTASGSGSGTGFVLNGDAYVATNRHVVEGWRSLEVKQGDRTYPADFVAGWESLDLAVIRVRHGSFGALPLGLREPEPLDAVVAFGHPGVSESDREPTRTPGTVNKRVYRGSWGAGALQIIEHSAPVNPGNSGGPLVDRCGRVIGVNTQAPLVELAPGVRVTRASGVYWSSHIAELARKLDALGVSYESSSDPCEGPPAAAPGASEQELEDLRREIEEQQRRTEAEDADQRAAAEARLAELRTRLEEAVAGQEADEARHAETQSEIADLREEFAARWVTGLGVAGAAVLLLAAIAFFALASFRRAVLQVAGRVREGASSMVRPRRSRVTPAAVRATMAHELHIHVGRGAEMDVTLASPKVSRFHAEIASARDGFLLTDRESTNGTRVFRDGRWRAVAREVVAPDERLELGDYRTTAAVLVRMATPGAVPGADGEERSDDRPAGPVKRDPRTGEIVQD